MDLWNIRKKTAVSVFQKRGIRESLADCVVAKFTQFAKFEKIDENQRITQGELGQSGTGLT